MLFFKRLHFSSFTITILFVFFASLSKAQETINFKHSQYEEFIQASKNTGKLVMIYFTGTGCTLCVKMERQVFPQQEIYSFFNESFINVESFDDFRKPDSAIKQLRAKYGIVSQPTFIFIDSNEEVIHKSGYKEKADFLLVGKQALGVDNYRNWLALFDKGEYQVEVVKKYLAVEQKPSLYAEAEYVCKAQDLLDKYFSAISTKEYVNKDNWDIIYNYVSNPYSTIFKYFLANKSSFIQQYGIKAVNEKIYSVYDLAWSGDMSSTAYKNAEKTIRNSVEPMAKQLLLFREMDDESSTIKREMKIGWTTFTTKYNAAILEYSYLVNAYSIYSITVDITSRTPKDLQSIGIANKWMEQILSSKSNEDEDYYTAYAKTFFLLGNKKAAIEAQTKAVEIAVSRNVEAKYVEEYKAFLAEYVSS